MTAAADDWTRWLDEHGPALVLFARQWAPDQAAAEDVVQEAFLRFWRSRHNAVDPAAYLYTCVKHCALDWLRGRRRREQREEAAARPEAWHDDRLFAGPLEQDERRAAIEAALCLLPEVQREVQAEIDRAEGRAWPMIGVERYAFYERAKQAYAVIQTGERRFYGCIALRKGVIPPEA